MARRRIRPILGFWGSEIHKNGAPINRRAKFDADSFILGREIRNRTNKQTNTQTVNDISTSGLSACVDN